MTQHATDTATPDYPAIKTKQQAAWGSGDYAVVGSTLNIVGEQLAEAADINPDERKALDSWIPTPHERNIRCIWSRPPNGCASQTPHKAIWLFFECR